MIGAGFVIAAISFSTYYPIGAEPLPSVDPTQMAVAYFQQDNPVEGIKWTAVAVGHPELSEWAILTGTCESSLRYAPKENPPYGGIMQQALIYWEDRAKLAGVPGADVENPFYNVYVSIKMVGDLGYPTSHWECSPW